MSLTNWKSEYLTVLKLHVPDITGFDEVFSDISEDYLLGLVSMIIKPEMNKGMYIDSYDEIADFLDGNGFKVEGSEKYGYTITLLKT